MSAEAEVLAANAKFYDAFAERDLMAMDAAWTEDSGAVCVHPGWPPIRGRDAVLRSFRSIFEHDEGPTPTCENPTCRVMGDSAVIVCRERLGGAVLIATNVYVREDDTWRMLHHHASALARVPDTPDLDPELLPN